MAAAVIAVNPELELPPYLQIFEQIRAAIERGELAPESALPTVRQLADDLGVAPNTVARAYADLQDAGWLVSEGRRGTRVANKTPGGTKARSSALTDAIAHFIDSLRHRGYNDREIGAEFARVLQK